MKDQDIDPLVEEQTNQDPPDHQPVDLLAETTLETSTAATDTKGDRISLKQLQT